jgi:hypothetical protein
VYVDARCKGILDDDEPGLTNDGGWLLRLGLRLTLDDATYGDMTVIDLPQLDMPFPATDEGSLQLSGQPQLLLVLDEQGLPPCTLIEVLSVEVRDPDNNEFAVLGAGVRPK